MDLALFTFELDALIEEVQRTVDEVFAAPTGAARKIPSTGRAS